jgi:hypothetical protein
MSASASSSHNTNPQTTNQSELWKAAVESGGNDLSWEQLYYVEKNTFLEFGDQDDLEGQGKTLRRARSDSSLSTGNGSRRGSFTPGMASAASSAPHPASQPRWYHGCYMKYRLGACNEPSCAHLHDLDGKETACFIAWTERENHVVFRSDRSDSSGPVPGYRSRDLGDDSDVSSDDDAEEEQLDLSSRRVSQPKATAYHDLAQQLREKFKDCDNDTLVACLPRDSEGQLTSIGSTLHESNKCKPCRYKITSQPCADGLRCLYCHMDHCLCPAVGSASSVQQPAVEGRSKVRPCKGKRDRYRKHVSRISEQIMADPFSWSAETMDIPPSIECNPELKRKFMARMAVIAEQARTRGAHAASSSSAMGTTMPPSISSGGPMGVRLSDAMSTTAADSDGQHLSPVTDPTKPRKLLSL